MPDFLQTDPAAGFAKSGSQFCAPTAVSNSLMWLAANGYEELRPAGSAKKAQIASGFSTQRISLEELAGGTLTGIQRNLPRSAEGYYEVGGEMAIADGWTCILDGAVFLTLE